MRPIYTKYIIFIGYKVDNLVKHMIWGAGMIKNTILKPVNLVQTMRVILEISPRENNFSICLV